MYTIEYYEDKSAAGQRIEMPANATLHNVMKMLDDAPLGAELFIYTPEGRFIANLVNE